MRRCVIEQCYYRNKESKLLCYQSSASANENSEIWRNCGLCHLVVGNFNIFLQYNQNGVGQNYGVFPKTSRMRHGECYVVTFVIIWKKKQNYRHVVQVKNVFFLNCGLLNKSRYRQISTLLASLYLNFWNKNSKLKVKFFLNNYDL